MISVVKINIKPSEPCCSTVGSSYFAQGSQRDYPRMLYLLPLLKGRMVCWMSTTTLLQEAAQQVSQWQIV